MADEQYPTDDPTRARNNSDAGDAKPATPGEPAAITGGPDAPSDDAATRADGAENLSGAAGGEEDAASAVSRGSELSAGQADQLAALEALFTAIATQQKQSIDLIERALADNANALAALADLRRMVEQNAGQNGNDNRNGMQ